MNIRFFTFFLLLTVCLTACDTPTPPPAVAPTAVATAAAARPTDDGLIIGVSADSPPFVYREGDDLVGFDIDLLNAILAEADLEARYEETRNWTGIFQDLAAGRFDIVISAATITPQRRETVTFTDPYFNAGLGIAYRGDTPISGPDQLAERPVGVQQGTTGELWVRDNTAARLVPFRDAAQALGALHTGDVAAVIHDRLILTTLLAADPQPTIVIDDQTLTDELYGIAVRTDDPLLVQLNAALAAVRADGRYGQLCEKWFGTMAACLPAPSSNTVAAGSTTAPPLPTAPPPSSAAPTAAPPTAVSDIPLVDCTVPPPAAATGRAYQVVAGDSLSSIAESNLGNPYHYRAIVRETNNRCSADAALTCVENPSFIQIGWGVYLPTQAELDAYWGTVATLPSMDPAAVGGDLTISGSSTVYPLTRQLAACFQEQGFDGRIDLRSIGTGAGFEQFCRGEAAIVDASRPITAAEEAACRANGRDPVAFQVGTDTIAVVVNGSNTFAQDVTLEELRRILATAERWSQVRAGWPDAPINRYYPTADSGTFDIMTVRLFNGDFALLQNAPGVQRRTENDLELVADVQADPFGVSFFGYAFYTHNRDALRTLAVGGIRPSPEAADQGTYLLSRPLYLYTTADLLQTQPQTAAFINYYLRNIKDYVTQVGYFLAPEAAADQAIETYNTARP